MGIADEQALRGLSRRQQEIAAESKAARDALKAETLRLIRPVRSRLGKLVHNALGR